MIKALSLAAGVCLLAACSSTPVQQPAPAYQWVSPYKVKAMPKWTRIQRRQPVAIVNLSRSEYSSSHHILLNTQERPHYHDHHDLIVTVVSGQSQIHFKDHTVVANPGDVIFIPKGTYHWAENLGEKGAEVHAIFSPAFDGKDIRLDQP